VENLFREETKKVKKRKKAAKATLSFAMDEEGDGDDSAEVDSSRRSSSKDKDERNDEGPPSKRGKFRKNPNVDTSFLPDRDREEAERKERERLRQEWLKNQEDIKKEEIEVTYSFWDGSGHRKSVTVSCSHSFIFFGKRAS
jgi:protein FAM50